MEVFTACKQLKHRFTRTILRTGASLQSSELAGLSFGRARVIIMQAGREVLVKHFSSWKHERLTKDITRLSTGRLFQ